MYLSNRLYLVTGVVLIAIAVLLALTIASGMAVTDADPLSKADTAKMLKDTYDHRTADVISLVSSFLLDCGFGLVVGGLLYLVFRDRSRLLAIILLIGFIGNSALSAATDVINASTLLLANDFTHGGAGLNAGDPAILEVAHLLGYLGTLFGAASGSMIAVSFLAMGWLIARAPSGKVNPPPAIGWIMIVSGIATLLGWAQFAIGAAGFFSFIVFGITTLVFTVWLGVWLIARRSTLPPPDGATG